MVSGFGVVAGVMSIGVAVACYVAAALYRPVFVRAGAVMVSPTAAARGGRAVGGSASSPPTGRGARGTLDTIFAGGLSGSVAGYATSVAWLGFAFLTLALVARAAATGHAPFANMYEFSLAFSWGILATYLYFEARYRERSLGLVALPIALLLIAYAMTLPAAAAPLVPALQNNLLLTVHVATAIVAYGTFAVAFAAAILRLSRPETGGLLPSREILDDISYRAVVIGFPFLTLTIALGAVWADIAWGSYWSWDPKETASLVTWLIYGAYLHARVVRGWRGDRAGWLLVLGFAAIAFTFFGNLFLGGQHSYAGV